MKGKTILHYHIEKELGRGGMGVVYLANDNKLKRQVAIKFLPGNIARDAEERQRFEIEAQAAAALNHPNIATIYAIEETDEAVFIVMEYVDGQELTNRLNTGPLSLAGAINITRQIAAGLQVAHDKAIIHRDIKAGNIMLSGDDRVKIMDFGLAKMADAALKTREGTTLGTIAYMSPEQATGSAVDHRSDIWSLGVLFYEMIAGQRPFGGEFQQQIIYSILNEDPPKISEIRDDLPDQLDAVFRKALAKDPEQRYSSMTELAADLQEWAGSAGKSPEMARGKGKPPEDPDWQQIGPYKIQQMIGEGGMGEVYLAEQAPPLRRKVALKIIKLGMDSKRIVARFEAERQALAVMDHPNIATVFEAGTTERGRPYFVMEYVPGIPLVEYCDKNKLSTAERLKIFAEICNAVQHAHQKGVVHRDLKPSNILIMLAEGKPVPKIIDFGIAKAIHMPLTEKTLVTALGEAVGTPAYMSPEQLESSQLDIDTRSDIYSLGVILYELLSGCLPFELADYQKPDPLLQQLLAQTDPPTPSRRLQTLGEEKDRIAKNRRTDVYSLQRRLKGDLDWITIKAMEKDRSRRYQTANGLRLDIDRYLADEPVIARPPSSGYRLAKFVARNKLAVVAGAVALGGLIFGLIFATIGFMRASEAEAKARLEAESTRQVSDFLLETFNVADPGQALGDTITARALLDRSAARISRELREQPEIQSRMMYTMGRVYANLGLYEKGIALLDSARVRQRALSGTAHPELAKTLLRLGYSYHELGQDDLARKYLKQALTIYQQRGDAVAMLPAMISMVDFWHKRAEADSAEMLAREALEIARQHPDAPDASVAQVYMRMAKLHNRRGEYTEALRLGRQGLAQIEKHHGEISTERQEVLNDLAVMLENAGELKQAQALHLKVVAASEKTFGTDHWQTAISYDNLGTLLSALNEHDEGLSYYRRAGRIFQKLYGPDHVDVGINLNNQGHAYYKMGDFKSAEKPFREANRIFKQAFGENHPYVGISEYQLANVQMQKGDLRSALRHNGVAVKLLREGLGEKHPRYGIVLRQAGVIYGEMGRYNAAGSAFTSAVEVFQNGQPIDSSAIVITLESYLEVLKKAGSQSLADSISEMLKQYHKE